MAFSSGAQRDLYYAEEDSYGVPVTGGGDPTVTEIRNTEDTISLSRDNFVSNERRGDRGIHDMRLGNKQPAGDINFEFSYASFDDFLEGALCSDWATDELKKGTTVHSYCVERVFSDLATPEYQFYTGGVVNGFSLDVAPNGMITGSFSFLFQDAANGTSAYHTGTPTEVNSNRPFDSFSGDVKEGGSAIATISSFNFTLDNGFERNFVVMQNKAPQVTSGKSNITGSITLYFEDSDEYDKFVDETESSLYIEFEDNGGTVSGNKYKITLPRIKYTSADTPVNSDGAVICTMNFQALEDATEESNIVIERVAAVNA
jgi:hypothetical protein